MADAVVGAQAAATEGGRRKTARLGGEVARGRVQAGYTEWGRTLSTSGGGGYR